MTMIISCATQDYAVQVSDRRLVWPDGRVAEDHENKGVLFLWRVAFAYTGLARIEGQSTHGWLARTLGDDRCVSTSEALKLLKQRGTEAVRRIAGPEQLKRLTFVGVGWTRQTGDPVLRPLICHSGNYFPSRHGSPASSSHFTNRILVMRPNESIRWVVDGARLPPATELRLKHTLRRYARKDRGPERVIHTLVATIRERAETNCAIGKNLLSVVVPREAVEHDSQHQLAISGPPVPGTISFQSWADGLWSGEQWGPDCASPGLVMTDFKAGALLPPGCRLHGGMTVGASGEKTIHYPCCAVRKRGTNEFLTQATAAGKCIVIFTERHLLEGVLQARANATAVCFDGPNELLRFLAGAQDVFVGVYFNPGGPDERTGSLALARFMEALSRGGTDGAC